LGGLGDPFYHYTSQYYLQDSQGNTSVFPVDTNANFVIIPATLARGSVSLEIVSTSTDGVDVGDPFGNLYYPQGTVDATFDNEPPVAIDNYTPYTPAGPFSFTLDAIVPYTNASVTMNVYDMQSNLLNQASTTLSGGSGVISWDGTSNGVPFDNTGILLRFQLTSVVPAGGAYVPLTGGAGNSNSTTIWRGGVGSKPLRQTFFAFQDITNLYESYAQTYMGDMTGLDYDNDTGGRSPFNYFSYPYGYDIITLANQTNEWANILSYLSNTSVSGVVLNVHSGTNGVGIDVTNGWYAGLTTGQIKQALGGQQNVELVPGSGSGGAAAVTYDDPGTPMPVVFIMGCNSAALAPAFGTPATPSTDQPSAFVGFEKVVSESNNLYEFSDDFWNYFAGDFLYGVDPQPLQRSFKKALSDWSTQITQVSPVFYGNINFMYNQATF
jgi:hypothetical protein